MQPASNQAVIFRHSVFRKLLESGIEVKASCCLKFLIPLDGSTDAMEHFLALDIDPEQALGMLLNTLGKQSQTLIAERSNEKSD